MAITYVGQAVGTTTATLPAHQAGDLILAFAYRDGSTTAPTVPTGWTTIDSGSGGGGSSNSSALAYRIAVDSSTVSGTWTNATGLVIQIYRDTAASFTGSGIGVNTGSTSNVSYPGVGLSSSSGSSWVAAFAGHRSVNTTLETPPTGLTLRSTRVDATCEVAGFDSDGGITSFGSSSVSVGGTASNWIARTVEIRSSVITGDADLSATATLSASGEVVLNGAADLSVSGLLSAVGTMDFVDTPSLSASGSMVTAGSLTIPTGAASLAGSGSVGITDTYSSYTGFYKRTTEDGNFRTTEDGTYRIQETALAVIHSGDAALAATGSVSASGTISMSGSMAASGTGSMTATGTLLLAGSADLTGVVSFAAAGDLIYNGSASLAGAGTLEATWELGVLVGSASLAGSGSVAADGSLIKPGTASLAATGSLSAIVDVIRNGDAALSATGSVTVNGELYQVGQILVKNGGEWKPIAPYAKHNGVWKQANVWVKTDGVWKRIHMVTEVKISELPAATAAVGTMQLEANDSGTSKRVTAAQVLSYVLTNIVIDEPNFSPILDLGTLP